jgi:hypothetical protein
LLLSQVKKVWTTWSKNSPETEFVRDEYKILVGFGAEKFWIERFGSISTVETAYVKPLELASAGPVRGGPNDSMVRQSVLPERKSSGPRSTLLLDVGQLFAERQAPASGGEHR